MTSDAEPDGINPRPDSLRSFTWTWLESLTELRASEGPFGEPWTVTPVCDLCTQKKGPTPVGGANSVVAVMPYFSTSSFFLTVMMICEKKVSEGFLSRYSASL